MGRRGPKKHLSRLAAPRHWMLDKLSGKYAPKPSPGPHKGRECLPMAVLLRNKLKYALTMKEVTMIVMQRHIKVDGKVRTDTHYPVGFMDSVTIEKTGQHFRLSFDTKGRFFLVPITHEDTKMKLCRVKQRSVGKGGVPHIVTHDGRTLRYPDPEVKVNDTVLLNINDNKIVDHVKFEVGNIAMITGGFNHGRVGVIFNIEKHDGGYTICHLKDARGSTFLTRNTNVFAIGHGTVPLSPLPRGDGIRLSIEEEKVLREKKTA